MGTGSSGPAGDPSAPGQGSQRGATLTCGTGKMMIKNGTESARKLMEGRLGLRKKWKMWSMRNIIRQSVLYLEKTHKLLLFF